MVYYRQYSSLLFFLPLPLPPLLRTVLKLRRTHYSTVLELLIPCFVVGVVVDGLVCRVYHVVYTSHLFSSFSHLISSLLHCLFTTSPLPLSLSLSLSITAATTFYAQAVVASTLSKVTLHTHAHAYAHVHVHLHLPLRLDLYPLPYLASPPQLGIRVFCPPFPVPIPIPLTSLSHHLTTSPPPTIPPCLLPL